MQRSLDRDFDNFEQQKNYTYQEREQIASSTRKAA